MSEVMNVGVMNVGQSMMVQVNDGNKLADAQYMKCSPTPSLNFNLKFNPQHICVSQNIRFIHTIALRMKTVAKSCI